MTTQNNNVNFFNFTAEASAYLNEIKVVKLPRGGDPFVAIKATILEGKDGKEKIPVDLILRGEQAAEVLNSQRAKWPQGYGHSGPTWFAGLRIGSLNVKPFTKKDGTPGAVLSGRLLAIKWLKINKEDIQVPPWQHEDNQASAERKVA